MGAWQGLEILFNLRPQHRGNWSCLQHSSDTGNLYTQEAFQTRGVVYSIPDTLVTFLTRLQEGKRKSKV